ncbi:hypothetical protein F3I01_04190 [Bacillus sp. SRB1LM]|nr:hypothetical protein [Bacillus sp. SRB1LM]
MTSEEIRNLQIDGVDVPFYDESENIYIYSLVNIRGLIFQNLCFLYIIKYSNLIILWSNTIIGSGIKWMRIEKI